jgi:2-C-methyl-D-erythritol 4-phosphate cytidylyltransferase
MLQMPSCTAVLLAGGGGSRLYPLNASGTPKVLLPVANRPLLSFPLRMLEESGVSDVLVVRPPPPLPACGLSAVKPQPVHCGGKRETCSSWTRLAQRPATHAAPFLVCRCARATWRRRRCAPGWPLATTAACPSR